MRLQARDPLVSPLLSASNDELDEELDELGPSWTMPHYNLKRAGEVAHKLIQEELALVVPATALLQLSGAIRGSTSSCSPFHTLEGGGDHHKTVRFAGLYVVHGPTERKHIRYAMELAVPELQLRTRVIQRFRNFHLLRTRLLRATKRCRHEQLQRQLEATSSQSLTLAPSWRELPPTLQRRSLRCHTCRSTYKALKAVAFPRRRVFTVSAEHIRDRSFQLEAFLTACMRLLVEWPGCARGRQLFAAVLGKFLGIDILQQLFPSRYGQRDSDGCAVGPLTSGNTTGLSSRSGSSYYSALVASDAHGGGLSSRTLLSARSSSSSSLSLHDV